MTTTVLRVFVSFSGREPVVGDLVRLLWERLAAHGLRVFNYETTGGAIAAGDAIPVACEREIDRADRLIAVVSDAAFESPSARGEVRYALSLERPGFVLPLVLAPSEPRPEPYGALHDIKALHQELRKDRLTTARIHEVVEKAVETFCMESGVPYCPAVVQPRLPLARRLREELTGAEAEQPELKSQALQILSADCEKFMSAYADGNLEKARKILDRMIERVDEEFPSVTLYYPRVVMGTLDLALAEDDQHALREVQTAIEHILDECGEVADANADALLGEVHLRLGEPAEALDRFARARERLETRDPAIFHNMLLAALLAERHAQIVQLLDETNDLDRGLVVSEPGTLKRMRLIRAAALCLLGETERAVNDVVDFGVPDAPDFDLVRQMLDTAVAQAKLARNYRLACRALHWMQAIESVVHQLGFDLWVQVVHRRAFLALELGWELHAVETIESVFRHDDFEQSARLHADAALIHHAAGNSVHAVQHAVVASRKQPRDRQTPALSEAELHYFVGLASWLLSRDDVAMDRHDQAGGREFAKWYAEAYPWVDRQALTDAQSEDRAPRLHA